MADQVKETIFQKFIIVAGSFKQYEDWKRANRISFNDKNYRYCYDLGSIRGFHSDEWAVRFIGTYSDRADAQFLFDYFRLGNFTIV